MKTHKLTVEVYETAALWSRLFNKAVAEAQEINRKNGLPNVFSRNGYIYHELPNGEIVKKEKMNSDNKYATDHSC